MQTILADADDINQTRKMIQAHLNDIELLAETIIQAEGYQYPVTAKLEQAYFPIKTYGDCTFPEGNYEALRVEIGKAQGKNWWCVLYPNLCFVDATHAVVPRSSRSLVTAFRITCSERQICGLRSISRFPRYGPWISKE